MRVRVDEDRCESNGFCMQRAPEVFRLRDDDTLEVLNAEPDAALRDSVEAAARSCPKGAITLE